MPVRDLLLGTILDIISYHYPNCLTVSLKQSNTIRWIHKNLTNNHSSIPRGWRTHRTMHSYASSSPRSALARPSRAPPARASGADVAEGRPRRRRGWTPPHTLGPGRRTSFPAAAAAAIPCRGGRRRRLRRSGKPPRAPLLFLELEPGSPEQLGRTRRRRTRRIRRTVGGCREVMVSV